jgi:glycosyltransferase involved in cell wall biosynthesis
VDELEVAARMNLCFVTPTYLEAGRATNSGVATAIHALACGLLAAGHAVQVVALSRTAHGDAALDGVRVHYVQPDQLHWYLFKVPLIGRHLAQPLRELANSLRLARAVRCLHRQQPFDLIEATETGGVALALQRIAPLLIRLHGEEYTFAKHTPTLRLSLALRLTRALQWIALRRAKALIAPSAAHAQTIAEELGYRAERVHVVPHGLPLPSAQRALPSEAPLVLFVGRLEAVKGIRDALIAFAKARQAVPQAQLIVIGGNHPTQPQAALDSLIAQLKIGAAVRQLSSLPQAALSAWYAQARALLMPSYYESFGLVALEAMAHGLPIVGYASGALPELIARAGLLVPRGDVEALAHALVRTLTDDQLRQRLSAHAMQRAAHYTVARQVEQSLAIYRSVSAKDASVLHDH